MNQDDTQNPFLTKPKEAPKKVKPIGGMMGFFDGETESEDPLGSRDNFYEALKDAPFNLIDPSKPSEAFSQSTEINPETFYAGSIDFKESNRQAEEAQKLNDLKTQIEQSDSGIIVAAKPIKEEAFVTEVWENDGAAGENDKFDLKEVARIADYIKFGEFFSIIGGESMFGFKSIKSLVVENILPPKRNPKLEARQKMTPEQIQEDDKKQLQNRRKASFFAQLRQIIRGSGMKKAVEQRRQNINMQVGLNTAFEGSVDEQTGEIRMDLQILADKKNSEMRASELKAKKQQQMAVVGKGGKNLRTHLGAQEGQSMVANAVLTAG